MRKRRPAFDPNQGMFHFEAPILRAPEVRQIPHVEGQLEGLDRRVASAVGHILAEASRAGRTRYDVAGGVSELLGDDVSKMMLDAYASESREGHNISFGRFLALVADTHSYGVLNALLAEIGATIVVGEEIATVELGHVQAQMRDLKVREQQLLKVVKPITRGGE